MSDLPQMERLRSLAAAEVAAYKVNCPLRHIVRMDETPVGKRPWLFTSGEIEAFQIPLEACHHLLIAYAAFENYTGKKYPSHMDTPELVALLHGLREQRHGTAAPLPLAKVTQAEFCWLAATVFDIAADVAARFYLKRESNNALLGGLAS